MKRKAFTKTEFFVAGLIVAAGFAVLIPVRRKLSSIAARAQYRGNLRILFTAMRVYANDYGQYPRREEWCDLLVDYNMAGMREDLLYCDAAGDPLHYFTSDPNKEPNFPVDVVFLEEHTAPDGQRRYAYRVKWSHYALNPNAKPNGPSDIVLLFSSKGGWNQFGGPEILNSENHLSRGRRGCYILFNDGRVKWVKAKDIGKLNWGTAGKEKEAEQRAP